MTLDTVTLAIGPKANKRTETLANAVVDIGVSTDATVVLLHVFSKQAYREGVEEAGYDPDDPPPAHTLASRLESIDGIAAELQEADIDYRIHGEIGEKRERILAAVEELDTDMLLISGRKRSPTGKAVFGSTAQEMMMNAPCLVTFVRQDIYAEE